MKRFALFGCILASTAAAGLATPVVADETNPHIVHRQSMHKIASGHMGALKAILFLKHEAQGQTSYHADAIVEAFKHMGNGFPAGSDKGQTKARAEIWTQPEKFKKGGENAFAAAMALAEATHLGDQKEVIGAYKKLGESCKTCHDNFRKK